LSQLQAAPKLGLGAKVAYAFGSVASTVEARGAGNFLLIFYNQVVGMPAYMIATVTLIMTVFDVFLDPAVGHISDHFHSRWGRRHPFIYASVFPLMIGYSLLWCPPQSSHEIIFAYLLGVMALLRLAGTCFELASAALLPELTQDYNERTNIIAIRQMLGLIGGMAITLLAYQVFLKEMPGGKGGVLSRDGYLLYGLVSAGVIGVSVLVSAFGTHRRIPYLAKPQTTTRPSIGAMLHEVRATLSNPSFVALIVTGMLMSVGNGTKTALDLYFQLYFWQLRQSQLSMLLVAAAGGTLLAMILAPWLARRFGKRVGAVIAVLCGTLGNVGPVLARLMHLMPANGTPQLFWILLADSLFTYTVATSTLVLMTSMLNDVVEDLEVKTGRRSEGLLFAADNMFRKLVSGVGIMFAGVILSAIAFPVHAGKLSVAPAVVEKLAYAYLPVTFLYLTAVVAILFYRIDRNLHEANLKSLRARAAQAASPAPAAPDPEGDVVTPLRRGPAVPGRA
jgi:GPH family glycoside/pentoside/hexuronide:cation symporter